MPTTTTVPLEGLAQRIAQQQSELEALRKELENRQARMARLSDKKEALEQRLASLDAEIEAVSQGKTLKRHAGNAHPGRPGAPAPLAAPSTPPKRMADLLVDIVREAKAPMTAQPLAAELQKRGFFTNSPNLTQIVKVRLNELVRQGTLRRPGDQPGVVIGKPAAGTAKAAGKKKGRSKRGSAGKSLRVGTDGKPQPSLRSIVNDILATSSRPMGAQELADQAKVRGYVTKSKSLKNVVWVTLGKMDGVENVSGEGYRLKKR
jgi:uncharacterized coiled-coil protein SlyX